VQDEREAGKRLRLPVLVNIGGDACGDLYLSKNFRSGQIKPYSLNSTGQQGYKGKPKRVYEPMRKDLECNCVCGVGVVGLQAAPSTTEEAYDPS